MEEDDEMGRWENITQDDEDVHESIGQPLLGGNRTSKPVPPPKRSKGSKAAFVFQGSYEPLAMTGNGAAFVPASPDGGGWHSQQVSLLTGWFRAIRECFPLCMDTDDDHNPLAPSKNKRP